MTPRLTTDDLDILTDSHTLAGRLFADAPLPCLIVDGAGTIAYANAKTESMLGWTAEELVGKSIETLVPLQHRARHEAVRAAFTEAARNRPMGTGFEVAALRRDGSEITVDIQLSPFVTAAGDRYTMAVLRDVTARRRETERLREFADRLAKANTELREKAAAFAKLDGEKNALLGMAAHDLRTPLSVVLGYGELLASLPQNEPLHQHRELVDAIVHTAKLMRHILDDLLDWAAIEAGTLRLSSYPVDPATVAADAVALAGLTAGRQGIQLSLEEEPGLPPAELDPDRIAQVLGNLLGNALKYSPSGSHVRVRVSRAGTDSVEFAVIDQGQGIPAEFLPHMFRPFETGGNTPLDGERAIGLGLAIVKRIIDAHGGTVSVESEPGKGSTFRVRIPIRRASR